MLCSKCLALNSTRKPNRDNDSSSRNHHHSNKSTDPNKDNKSDESNNGNECPECGRTFRNLKGLQIYQSSKHNRKQNTLTSAGFWPCRSAKRCDICNAVINFIQNHPPWDKPPGHDWKGAKTLPPGQSLYTKTLPRDKTGSQKPHPGT